MREILYLEIPTPDTEAVIHWLHHTFEPKIGHKVITTDGIRLSLQPPQDTRQPDGQTNPQLAAAIACFVWSVQRTTYLKAFCWQASAQKLEETIPQLTDEIRQAFPHQYPAPPTVDLSQQSIFEALQPHYPKTVHYFQRMPNGEQDLQRVYWWEQRWRASVRSPKQPQPVLFKPSEAPPNPKTEIPFVVNKRPQSTLPEATPTPFDLIYVGGALGIIHAAVMATLGHRVLLIERLPFGRMNREWNISRQEFQSLIDLGLFSSEEFEALIAHEYQDGFNKFFDANNPVAAQAPTLHTPTVLNIAIDSEKLLKFCGEKFTAAGGIILDETDFLWAEIDQDGVMVHTRHRGEYWRKPPEGVEPAQESNRQTQHRIQGRLLVDAMGTASPIAWQLNGGRAFDSVCPTVGACISGGIAPEVWNSDYGDVLFSHGDISRGRQLIWELFPGRDNELTVYLFHYHQVNPENPGSLLEMYEDFFHILPEYRRCDLDKLTWRKPTFGYIPGHFSTRAEERTVAFDRLVAIGDAASLQSPLVFTGFGSLVRNLPRLTELLDTALRYDLLRDRHLNQIRAFQSNIAVTWLFSRGMMVPTHEFIPPQRINSMLNTFFGVLGQQSPDVANRFIKDRATWPEFNRMALTAASQNPALLGWIWQLAGPVDMVRWVGSYLTFTTSALLSWCLSWFPNWLHRQQAWLEPLWPAMWYSLLAKSYGLTYGTGKPSAVQVRIQAPTVESLRTPRPKQPRRSVSEATADDERSPQPDIPQTDMPQPDMKVIR
ncbi:MAG: flavin-dependent dehydrogenase [Cyanobacteria bacterium P01_A01_bin.123]